MIVVTMEETDDHNRVNFGILWRSREVVTVSGHRRPYRVNLWADARKAGDTCTLDAPIPDLSGTLPDHVVAGEIGPEGLAIRFLYPAGTTELYRVTLTPDGPPRLSVVPDSEPAETPYSVDFPIPPYGDERETLAETLTKPYGLSVGVMVEEGMPVYRVTGSLAQLAGIFRQLPGASRGPISPTHTRF